MKRAVDAVRWFLGATIGRAVSLLLTGLGEVQKGEGVYGLQRAFLLAGAQNLVLSLFKVPSAETVALMSHFYAARAKGGVGLIVTGGMAPNPEGGVFPGAAGLHTPQDIANMALFTRAALGLLDEALS